ncbi:MAG: hypothetical protein WA003_05720 [Desulfuromonadaceae bacterium]
MMPHLPPDTTHAVHLRAASTSGGKDWVGAVTGKGEIHTFWGRTAHISQHAARPGDIGALHKLVSQKINGKDRYQKVDEYDPQHGWQSQIKQVEPQQTKPQAVAAPEVNWVEAPTAAIKWDF